MTMRQRQDAAIEDPFGYRAGEMPPVTSGKINEFDEKGFKRDVDRVLSP